MGWKALEHKADVCALQLYTSEVVMVNFLFCHLISYMALSKLVTLSNLVTLI
jgi:hypothetical protein